VNGDQRVAGILFSFAEFLTLATGAALDTARGLRGGSDTGMDTQLPSILPGRIVCRTGAERHFGGAGNGCDLGRISICPGRRLVRRQILAANLDAVFPLRRF